MNGGGIRQTNNFTHCAILISWIANKKSDYAYGV